MQEHKSPDEISSYCVFESFYTLMKSLDKMFFTLVINSVYCEYSHSCFVD